MSHLAWQDDAICATVAPDLFFPELGSNSTRVVAQLCDNCDVKQECLNFALTENIKYGIWGGKSPLARQRITNGRAA